MRCTDNVQLLSGVPSIYIQRVTSSQDKNAKPVVHPVRKIALALIPKLDELDSMLADRIIVPVEEPTDWVNSLGVRENPNGSLRVCLDPGDLNKAIRREHYPVPTVERVMTKLHGSTLFLY